MSILRELLAETEKKATDVEGYAFEKINCDNELFEIHEQYNDIVSDQEAIYRLEEIHDGLESLLEITESSIEEGGLTPVTAEVLRVSTEALVAPLGLTSPVLSQESFGAEGERLTSTRVSIEEEKGTIKKIWDAIARAMNALREKITAWYNAVINSSEKLKAKNDALLKAIDELSGKKVENDQKELEFSASSLLSSDQTEKNLTGNMVNLEAELKVFLTGGAVPATVNSMLGEFKKLDFSKLNSNSRTTLNNSIKESIEKYTKLSSTPKGSGIPKKLEMSGVQITKHGLLPGNKALYSYSSDDVTKCSWVLDIADENKNIKEKAKFSILSPGELKTLATENAGIIDNLIAYKAKKGSVDDLKKDIVKVGDDMVKAADSSSDGISGKYAKSLLPVLKTFEKQLNSPANQLTAHAIKVTNALMSLMGAMVKAYK